MNIVNGEQTIQIEANVNLGDAVSNNDLLHAAGVKRIHKGWYTVLFNGVRPDRSNVKWARRNRHGNIKLSGIK